MLAGCDTGLGVTVHAAAQFAPLPWYRDVHTELFACSGRWRALEDIEWYEAASLSYDDAPAGSAVAGYYDGGHRIYVLDRRARPVVRHEMLHYLLDTGDHPPVFARCAPNS